MIESVEFNAIKSELGLFKSQILDLLTNEDAQNFYLTYYVDQFYEQESHLK